VRSVGQTRQTSAAFPRFPFFGVFLQFGSDSLPSEIAVVMAPDYLRNQSETLWCHESSFFVLACGSALLFIFVIRPLLSQTANRATIWTWKAGNPLPPAAESRLRGAT
jgi:hypothetical protein